MNEIRYNLLTNEIISQNISESIVKGQSDNIKIKLYFEGGDFDYTWDVRNVFTRADGEKSNNIPAVAMDGYFELTLRSWMTDVVGELKVATRILIDGSEYKAFDQATLIVQEGELPSNDTIEEVQYDGLLGAINEKVAQSQYDSEMPTKVNKSGDTMTGPLGMGGNPIKDVDDAVDPQDAVTKKQLDVVVDETIRLDTIKADITYVDNEDANVLQEAKDYTYSQVEIDNKDTAIMNKANNLEDANMLKDVVYNNVNGVLTFTRYDDTLREIDLPLELLVESGYYDEVANELVLVLANGSEIRIPVGNLLTDLDAHNVRFNGSGTNYLVNKNDVESAVKELDTRVKTNADDVEKTSNRINNQIVDKAFPKYIAHRGVSGIAPENTLPAYEWAGKLGYWGAECDILVTSDGEWVLMHDVTVDRTTDGTGNVSSMTLNEIKELKIDFGNNISLYPNLTVPTLEEYLVVCKKHGIVPIIEVKDATYTTQNYIDLINIIKKYGLMNKVVIISGSQGALYSIRDISDTVKMQYVVGRFSSSFISVAQSIKNCDVNVNIINKEEIELCHENGINVNVWTVNSPQEAKEFIKNGVDYITTDILLEVL